MLKELPLGKDAAIAASPKTGDIAEGPSKAEGVSKEAFGKLVDQAASAAVPVAGVAEVAVLAEPPARLVRQAPDWAGTPASDAPAEDAPATDAPTGDGAVPAVSREALAFPGAPRAAVPEVEARIKTPADAEAPADMQAPADANGQVVSGQLEAGRAVARDGAVPSFDVPTKKATASEVSARDAATEDVATPAPTPTPTPVQSAPAPSVAVEPAAGSATPANTAAAAQPANTAVAQPVETPAAQQLSTARSGARPDNSPAVNASAPAAQVPEGPSDARSGAGVEAQQALGAPVPVGQAALRSSERADVAQSVIAPAREGVSAPASPMARAEIAVPRNGAESRGRGDRPADPDTIREPRMGTASSVSGTAASDRAGPQTVAAVPATPTPPTAFATPANSPAIAGPVPGDAAVRAALAEGEAEKAARALASAGDVEIAPGMTRVDRDIEFRPLMRQAPAAPVPAAELAREVMQAAISAKGNNSIELRLDPVELGKLDIEFSVIDDRMNIIVRADREEALDLMRRNADELQKMLREAGIDLGSLSFSQGGSRNPETANPFAVAGTGGEGGVIDGSAPVLASIGTSERLDIRI